MLLSGSWSEAESSSSSASSFHLSFSLSRRWFDDDEEEDDVDDEDDVVDAADDVMLTRWGPGVKRGERRGLENESGAVNGKAGTGKVK